MVKLRIEAALIGLYGGAPLGAMAFVGWVLSLPRPGGQWVVGVPWGALLGALLGAAAGWCLPRLAWRCLPSRGYFE